MTRRKIFEGNVSTQDATVVRNLRGAGAILLGKTNIPEFAFHYDSNNLVYGATHNPHDPERSVGGSSGGEGAALATGITPIGVGSDYGGSIRVPAHFNGVTGLKPGRWVVPYGGHFPPAQTMSIQLWSEIGPMARYVEDLQLLLPIFAQPDPTTDPDVAPHRVEPDQPESLRVAIFDEDGLCPVDPAIREAVRSAGRALEDAGHEVVEERPPNQAEVREVFEGIALAEIVSLLWPLIEPREEELSPQIRRLLKRRETLDVDLATYAGQLAHRLDLERAANAWLETNHIAVCPISATAGVPDRNRGAGDRRAGVRGDRPLLDVHLRQRDEPAGRRRARRPHARRPADRRPGDRPPLPRDGGAGGRARAGAGAGRLDQAGTGAEGRRALVRPVGSPQSAVVWLGRCRLPTADGRLTSRSRAPRPTRRAPRPSAPPAARPA